MAKYLSYGGLEKVWGLAKNYFPTVKTATVNGTEVTWTTNTGVSAGNVATFAVDANGLVSLTGITTSSLASSHTHALSIAADSGTSALAMAANTKYKLTAGGSTFIFTTPPNPSIGNAALKLASDSGTATQAFTANSSTASTITVKGDGTYISGAVSGSSNAPIVTLSHATQSGVTAATNYGPTTDVSGTNNTTIKIPHLKVDAAGHVTEVGEYTYTSKDTTYSRNVSHTNAAVTANTIPVWSAAAAAGNAATLKDGYTVDTTTMSSSDSAIPTSAAVSAAISGLSGAMHFVGTSTSTMTDGQTTNPTVSSVSSFSAGDVVVDATETEFVLGNEATPKWHKLGDANSYALSSVSITGTGALGGGGTLASNRTITHNTSALGISTDTSYGPGADVTGSNGTTIKVPQITVDKYGHITAVTERTYTSVNNTYTVNNAALNLQGSSGDAIASGFSANGSTATTFKFAVGTGDTISSIGVAKSSATNTITINGATMPTTLKNPNAVRLGDDTTYIDYDGSASGYQLSFTGSGVSLAKSGNVVTATITNTTYTLPVAKYNTLGGVKPAYNYTGNAATLGTTAQAYSSAAPTVQARTTTSGRYYAVEADKNGVLFVNVPWTDTSVTSSANHYTPSGTTAMTNTASGSGVSWGGAVVTSLTSDGKGHITGVKTSTLPSNPNVTTAAFVASSTSATSATAAGTTIANGSLYYVLREGSTNTATLITGSGGTTVTKDGNGTNRIIITSPEVVEITEDEINTVCVI